MISSVSAWNCKQGEWLSGFFEKIVPRIKDVSSFPLFKWDYQWSKNWVVWSTAAHRNDAGIVDDLKLEMPVVAMRWEGMVYLFLNGKVWVYILSIWVDFQEKLEASTDQKFGSKKIQNFTLTKEIEKDVLPFRSWDFWWVSKILIILLSSLAIDLHLLHNLTT